MTDKPAAKVVWVIGSGFSAGLGGPLLKDLLHPRTEKDYKSRFLLTEMHRAVLRMFRLHHPEHRHMEHGDFPTLWEHAEQFLDFLDCARDQTGALAGRFRERFGELAAIDAHKAACQLVAAECLFTDLRPDLRGEAWQPYVHWARWLKPSDTIVTFNYDRVLECLATDEWIKNDAEHSGRQWYLRPESFLIPGVQEPAEGFAKVYKLHGSVDWVGVNNTTVEVKPPDQLIQSNALPLIAMPGPTKHVHANGILGGARRGLLLWSSAYAVSTPKPS
jgi:hypothetical protein